MFKKLLTNLPYNPSLLGQVSFYAKRLHAEEKLRKLGLIFVGLAFIVQLFAFMSQPEPTLAESSNDIIRGGFTNKSQAVLRCLDTSQDFDNILAYYGVDCSMVERATTISIRSNAADYDSLGRNQQGSVIARTGKLTEEYAVTMPGVARPLWMKNLRAWDSGAYSTYKVLKVTNRNGKTILIMYNCGNIITVGRFEPPQPPPPPEPPDVCPNKPGKQTRPGDCDVCPLIPDVQYSAQDCDACPNIPGTQNSPLECKPCEDSVDDDDALACAVLSKTARNHTQNLDNADGTMAYGGDKIVYTLRVKNIGKTTIADYVMEENVADILDYAEIVDLHGGTLDGTYVTWPTFDIRAGDTVSRRLEIKVKDPIPRTPMSSSDPGRFDLIMNNVYGNEVNIKLPPDVVKTTESVTKALPNTGPGETLAAVVGFTVFISYFFARTHLFAKELDIVRTDYTTNGGY